ncbi:hypothetical protein J3R30DRAFT_1829094 [Lentinula aciculospora]|uniref:Uncharacterized protein n=1 Tax=Lentinula aciculospora TaxID=153920 RepID=A0A9W9AKB3_9AGAR|nr:hypothetical protein J3R30DRAFT_1829094 [Lentinula aciculospora]
MSSTSKLSLSQANQRLRRKPKAITGALGARLKAKAAPRKPSPLPPSSPFASSSESPIIQDSLPIATSEAHFLDVGKPFYEEVEEERDFESDVYEILEREADVQEFAHSARNSDPFGFFALEAKLKAERTHRSTETLNVPFNQPLKVPRSPHKPRTRKTFSALGSGSAISPSLPTSPSPAKPRGTKRSLIRETNIDETEKEHSDKHVSVSPDELPRKRVKTKTGGRGRQKQPLSDKSIDPATLARDLKALLPKRASRRDDKRRTGPNGDEADHKPRRGVKSGKESTNDTGDKERDTERQKRVEYFRKLEDYNVAKENVYVI